MKKMLIICAAALGASIPAASQAAVSVGDSVTCAVSGGGNFACNPPSSTIQAAGTEFGVGNGPVTFLAADFAAGMLTISALVDANLTFTILNFQNLTSQFTSFSLLGSSGFNGFDASDISLNAGLLSIDLRGTTNFAGGSIRLGLQSAAGAVPEPATWAIFLLGFGAVGTAMRRGNAMRRKQNVSVSYA
jgi:hypothetical protein